MTGVNSYRRQITVAVTITLALLSFISFSPKLKAQLAESVSNSVENGRVRFNPPPVPDNGKPGGRRDGAGSQSSCQISDQSEDTSLIALVPKTFADGPKKKTYFWGKTIAQHPTFWFYVNYKPKTNVEFVLQSNEGDEVYRKGFEVDGTPGVISFTLPPTVKPALETGKSYHWYFKIKCNPEDSTDDFVEGWIERVELNPDIQRQLAEANPLQRVAIYAENGIWHEALANLDQLRVMYPEDTAIATTWTDLLQQIDLSDFSQKPVVQRYIPEK